MTHQDTTIRDENAAETPESFGERVALAREARNMSREELAGTIGLPADTVRGWEDDDAEPTAYKLSHTAGTLDVSVRWLLTGDGHGARTDAGDSSAEARVLIGALREAKRSLAEATARVDAVEERLRRLL